MAVITSYATLQTKIADYLARSDLTDYIPDFIQYAENKLYRTLNLRNEETALSVTIASGVAAVPTDFKALKYAYVDVSPVQVLRFVTPEEIYTDYPVRSGAEIPSVISREGANFIFGPYPSTYTIKGIYYKKLDPLRTTDSTWYVLNAPEVLLYGSLLEAAPFIHGDERIQVWQKYYDDAVATLKRENSNAETSMGSLRQRVS